MRYTDLSGLEQLFKGDRKLIHDWIELYLQESPEYFTLLASCSTNGDAQALASAAHELLPQAHYLGCSHMRELLLTIEERALSDDVVGCAEPVSALLAVRATIDNELRTIRGTDRQ